MAWLTGYRRLTLRYERTASYKKLAKLTTQDKLLAIQATPR
jgi:hypothetical protein